MKLAVAIVVALLVVGGLLARAGVSPGEANPELPTPDWPRRHNIDCEDFSADVPAPDPKHYDNVDFEFAVDLPQGLPACLATDNNHGVSIALDRAAQCCDYEDYIRPHIKVFAYFNADKALTPVQLAQYDCRDLGKRVEWLHGATLGGHPAAGCRSYSPDGRVSIHIIALRKTTGPVGGWIEVGAYLETTAARYKRDLHIFLAVLKSVWIHPDGPRHAVAGLPAYTDEDWEGLYQEIPALNPRRYYNYDDEYAVDLPHGLPACVSAYTNHGVAIFLDRTVRCSTYDDRIPLITVYGAYNVPYEARTPAELARHLCPKRGKRVEWLHGATLGGHPAAGCRSYSPDGRVSLHIIALRKTTGQVGGWIEVGAYLETTADRYKRDLGVFQRVVKSVWIHADGPYY